MKEMHFALSAELISPSPSPSKMDVVSHPER